MLTTWLGNVPTSRRPPTTNAPSPWELMLGSAVLPDWMRAAPAAISIRPCRVPPDTPRAPISTSIVPEVTKLADPEFETTREASSSPMLLWMVPSLVRSPPSWTVT